MERKLKKRFGEVNCIVIKRYPLQIGLVISRARNTSHAVLSLCPLMLKSRTLEKRTDGHTLLIMRESSQTFYFWFWFSDFWQWFWRDSGIKGKIRQELTPIEFGAGEIRLPKENRRCQGDAEAWCRNLGRKPSWLPCRLRKQECAAGVGEEMFECQLKVD